MVDDEKNEEKNETEEFRKKYQALRQKAEIDAIMQKRQAERSVKEGKDAGDAAAATRTKTPEGKDISLWAVSRQTAEKNLEKLEMTTYVTAATAIANIVDMYKTLGDALHGSVKQAWKSPNALTPYINKAMDTLYENIFLRNPEVSLAAMHHLVHFKNGKVVAESLDVEHMPELKDQAKAKECENMLNAVDKQFALVVKEWLTKVHDCVEVKNQPGVFIKDGYALTKDQFDGFKKDTNKGLDNFLKTNLPSLIFKEKAEPKPETKAEPEQEVKNNPGP